MMEREVTAREIVKGACGDVRALVGARFAGYRLGERLGRGAQGLVVRAEDISGGHERALKLLPAAPRGSVAGQRFEREAKALERLSHRGVARVIDRGRSRGVGYLAMELVEGPTLADLIEAETQLESAWVARIFAGLAEALDHCHARGVVHRDVKPANIVLKLPAGEPVLVDFGLCKPSRRELASSSGSLFEGLSSQGGLLGTPAYASPEQVDVEGSFGEPGPASDAWSLGVCLFEVLSGALPFEAETDLERCVAVLTRAPRSLRALAPGVDPTLARLCEACLRRDPGRRPRLATLTRRLRARARRGGVRVAPSLFVVLGSVALVTAGFAFGSSWFGSSGPRLLELASPEGPVRGSAVDLSGRLSGPGWVELRGRRHSVAGDGRFRLSARLEEGINEIVLRVGGAEASVERRALRVERDSVAPRIELFESQRSAASGRLRGRVVDAGLCVLRRGGRPVALEADGSFDLELDSTGAGETLEAMDAAGNVASLDVPGAMVELGGVFEPERYRSSPHRSAIERALGFYDRGEVMDALAALSALTLQAPGCAPAWLLRGLCRARLEDHSGALGDYRAAQRRAPGLRGCALARVRSLAALGRFGEAESALDGLAAESGEGAAVAVERARLGRLRERR